MNWVHKWLDPGERKLREYSKRVIKINQLEDEVSKLTDEAIVEKTTLIKNQVFEGKPLDDVLDYAFALVREASKRTLGLRPFDVQLMGAMALSDGSIAEMKTGEGKTLASTLAIYLFALKGKGVHVITANDYLASRDSREMSVLFKALGLSTGLNVPQASPEDKRFAYNCDITYGTASEFGFDYLRDNMVENLDEKVQRSHAYVVVDEVDSILIDEARTPLIISGQDREGADLYIKADRFAKGLKVDQDYTFDIESKSASLTETGVEKAESYFSIDNLYSYEHVALTHHVDTALKARFTMKVDVDYMVKDDQVLIIDTFTGRTMEGRRFSDGLHQALEAKEGVVIERESRTLATITIQNYFRMYRHTCGMTGTAKTEEEEFIKIYNMNVICVPTNVPIQRIDHQDVMYATKEAKFNAAIRDIHEIHRTGQPILIGTISVETSEYMSQLLKSKGIKHNVLNAKNHGKEAEIIAHAGKVGAVTLATNMAGRGTDIKLDADSHALGGLAVIGTEKHESRRIDNQLRGRAGRQGDPGMSRFYLSTEDELVQRFGGERIKSAMSTLKFDENTPIQSGIVTKTIEASQKRVEGNHFDARKRLLEFDDVIRLQRETIYKQRDDVLGTTDTKSLSLNMINGYLDTFFPGDQSKVDWDGLSVYETLSADVLGANEMNEALFLDGLYSEARREVEKALLRLYNDREQSFSQEGMRRVEQILMLRAVDECWLSHIDALSRLREGIHLRAYAQTDPLREYQMEGYAMYEELIERIYETYTKMILRVEPGEEVRNVQKSVEHTSQGQTEEKKRPFVKSVRVGRNDPCPCGSGKKFKKCHGQ